MTTAVTPVFKRPLYLLSAIAIAIAGMVAVLYWPTGSGSKIPAEATWIIPDVPDTPAGRQLSGFLQAFNSGSEEELKRFVAQQFTPQGPGGSDLAARTGSQLRLYKSSRGLNLYEIVDSTDEAITFLAQFRLTEEWRRMTLMVESAPEHRISAISIMPIEPPVIAQTQPMSDQQLGQAIDRYVQGLVAADQFSGVVLVAHDGKPLFERAYGLADQEHKVSNQLSTRFSFASVGKMFTAIAVAQLVQQGKLAYDDTLSELLPEYPQDAGSQITVDHLLTHHSGIPDFFEDRDAFEKVADSLDPQRDYLRVFQDKPLRFAPGERFEYSNSGYILLGAIIERLSGLTYPEYLRQNVFEPAGMLQTSLAADWIDANLLARGYTHMSAEHELTSGPRHLADGFQTGIGSAAGGGYTTAGDLLRLERSLRTYKLLPEAATEQLFADRVSYERPGYRYGYGFILRKSGHEWVAGHSGGFPGVDAQFEMYLESGYAIIILANYELVAEPIITRVEQLLRRPPAPTETAHHQDLKSGLASQLGSP